LNSKAELSEIGKFCKWLGAVLTVVLCGYADVYVVLGGHSILHTQRAQSCHVGISAFYAEIGQQDFLSALLLVEI
jgi:hypothetical protein